MKTRMKIYAIISAAAVLYIGWNCIPAHGAEAEIPVTVTVINCLDYPDDERCRKFTEDLNEIAPDAGDYHPPEWTPDQAKTGSAQDDVKQELEMDYE